MFYFLNCSGFKRNDSLPFPRKSEFYNRTIPNTLYKGTSFSITLYRETLLLDNCSSCRSENKMTMVKQLHNILELKPAKFAIIRFPKMFLKVKLTHLQKGMVALRYILKIKGTLNKSPLELSRKLWDYLMEKGTTSTGGYLTEGLNPADDSQFSEG